MKKKNRLKTVITAAGIALSAAFYILSGDLRGGGAGESLLYTFGEDRSSGTEAEAISDGAGDDRPDEERLTMLLEPLIRSAVREELTAICREGYLEEALRQEAALAASEYAAAQEEKRGRVDINTAGQEELMGLPGIGEKKAADIIEFRERNGRFDSPEDIMLVPGIGNSLYDRISGSICT